MVQTTIAIDVETKQKLSEFKLNGETYNDLLLRLYKSACKRQLEDFLMDDTNCVTIDESKKLLKIGFKIN